MNWTYEDIAGMIDHSLLNPALTDADLEAGCQLAKDYAAASVCVMPYFTKRAAALLKGSRTRVGTTVGFPQGGQTTALKVTEANQAIDDGAQELDMVINISKAKSQDWDYVRHDIKSVVDAAHARGVKVKVIFENCFLTDEQKIQLCAICAGVGADWVKTSTGYGTGGATHADIKLMRAHSPAQVQVKAAGGIRDLDGLLVARELGITRMGASATRAILDEAKRRLAG